MELRVDQQVDAVSSGETCDCVGSLFPYPTSEYACHAHIERAFSLTREDLDASSPHDRLSDTSTIAWRAPVACTAIRSEEDRGRVGGRKPVWVRLHWHSDDSYKAAPCALTILYGVGVPPTGGDTQFINMYAAYDGLSSALRRRIDGLKVVHTYDSSRKGTRIAKLHAAEASGLPAVVQPLVRTHPETGRRALYMNPNRMEEIVGMPRAESDALLDALTEHATQPRYQYRHRWRQGDILIWDNRCTIHKANADYPAGSRRVMQRLMVAGTSPV